MGQIVTVTRTIETTGIAGSAAASDVTPVLMGYLLDIAGGWNASAPNTSDLVVKQTGRAENLLAIADSSTDFQVSPRASLVTRANGAITNAHDRIPLNGTITTTIAQSDPLAVALTLTIRYEAL